MVFLLYLLVEVLKIDALAIGMKVSLGTAGSCFGRNELDLLWVRQMILVVDECIGLVISPPGLSVKHARSLCVDSIVVMIACKFPCVSMHRVDWSLIDLAKPQSHGFSDNPCAIILTYRDILKNIESRQLHWRYGIQCSLRCGSPRSTGCIQTAATTTTTTTSTTTTTTTTTTAAAAAAAGTATAAQYSIKRHTDTHNN